MSKQKTGGRKKGTLNKRTVEVIEICERMNINPIELLIHIAKGDWEALGYDSPTLTRWLPSGIEYEEDRIQLEHRMASAKELSTYIFSKRKSVEHTVQIEKPELIVVHQTEWGSSHEALDDKSDTETNS